MRWEVGNRSYLRVGKVAPNNNDKLAALPPAVGVQIRALPNGVGDTSTYPGARPVDARRHADLLREAHRGQAGRRGEAAKESYAPPKSPRRREHRSQPPGARLRGSDKQNQALRGAAPFAKPVLERDEATGDYYVSEDRAYDSTATQAAPELATRFNTSSADVDEQGREGMGPAPFARATATSSPSRTRSRPYTHVDHVSTNPSSTTRASTRDHSEKSPFRG